MTAYEEKQHTWVIILSSSHDLAGLWSRFPNYNWSCGPSSVAGGTRRLQPKGQQTFSLSPRLETINNAWEKWLCCADPYVADVLCSLGEVGWRAAARGDQFLLLLATSRIPVRSFHVPSGLAVRDMLAAVRLIILLFLPEHLSCNYFQAGTKCEGRAFDYWSIQGEVSMQKDKSGRFIILHVQNIVALQQGLMSLQRHVQGEGSASKHVLFLMSCVRRSRTKASILRPS